MSKQATPLPKMVLGMEAIRIALRLSQQEFADLLGVTRRSVVRWEQGAHAPHPSFVRRAEEISKEVLSGQPRSAIELEVTR